MACDHLISVRVDERTKQRFRSLASRQGLSESALLKRLQQTKTDDETDWARMAVVQAAQRIPQAEGPSKHVAAAYAAAKVWDIFPGNAGGKNPLSNKPRDLNPTKQYYEKRLDGYHGR